MYKLILKHIELFRQIACQTHVDLIEREIVVVVVVVVVVVKGGYLKFELTHRNDFFHKVTKLIIFKIQL